MTITAEYIEELLESVRDPEIPLLSIREMGILRGVEINGDKVIVKITPTYSGCPAMYEIRADIVKKLRSEGIDKVSVIDVLSPAWTTDWMTEEARHKLVLSGIAPPVGKSADNLLNVFKAPESIACPFCGSSDTEKKSEFAATACKSLFFCKACHQPFEHFKCH